ncbi:MAG: hypothetical protein QGG40_14615, partial [Myxococcota bacterium]|nr:hypothetical protein [Myxococcota bacterium]
VEGFVPDEEQPASGRRAASSSKGKRRTTNRVEAPSDWDLPIPEPLEPGQLRYVALTEEDQDRLRGEESSQQIADDAVQLAVDMFEVVCDPTDPTSVTDLAPYLEEVRDFLLAEGQLGRLNELVATMKNAKLDEVENEKLDRILSTFVGFRAIQRVIRGISKVSIEPPEELIVLLDASGADPLVSLLELLVAERSEIARRMTRQLIERYASNNPEGLIEQIYVLESSVAQDLLRACARALPERAVEASIQLVERQELGLQLEVLRVLQSAPYAGKVAQALVKLLGSEVLEVRIRVIQQLTERGDSRAFEVMVDHVEATAARGLEHEESERLGEALAQVDPVQAAKVFSNWIRPRGLFRRFVEVPGQPMMQWTAVAGFEFIVGDAGEKGEKLVRWLAKRSGEEVHKRCMATLARRKLRERDSLAESGEEQGDVA